MGDEFYGSQLNFSAASVTEIFTLRRLVSKEVKSLCGLPSGEQYLDLD